MQQELPEIGAPLAGGFFAGRFLLDGQAFALIVSPKDAGDLDDTQWNGNWSDVDGAKSYNDGLGNTQAMAEAGSELAKKVLGLDIDGFNDWYLPSQDELEILYRNLKPTEEENYLYARSGINVSAIPPTYPYTADAPCQTSIADFVEGGAQAFEDVWYWSSTQLASNSDFAWCQDFGNGSQHDFHESSKLRARAVRRLPI